MTKTTHPLPSAPPPASHRWIIRLTFVLAMIILPLYAVKTSYKTDYSDFTVYFRTAERFKNHIWGEVYSLGDGTSPFRYAPPFLLFFRPLAEFSLNQAQLIWYFLQYFWFASGFYWIYRTIQLWNPSRALFLTCLSALFILRFCLDTFTIGQVSSLMFLGFSFGLFAWAAGRPVAAAVGIAVPALFKIGPSILFGVYLSGRWRERWWGLATALLMSFCPVAILGVWVYFVSAEGLWNLLWSGWAQIVSMDSVYYDASHYGSQSLKSFLLRLAKIQVLTPAAVHFFYVSLSLSAVLGTLAFWFFRRPVSARGRGLFYSLGIFIGMWVMPETFKYSLTPLAIPAALLLSTIFTDPSRTIRPPDRFTPVALGAGYLFLSLAGKDLIVDWLFFGLQEFSVPFFCTVLLGIATYRAAWRESTGTFSFLPQSTPLGPWPTFPTLERSCEISLLIPIDLKTIYDPRFRPDLFQGQLLARQELLIAHTSARGGAAGYEILLSFYESAVDAHTNAGGNAVFNPNPNTSNIKKIKELVKNLGRVRVLADPVLANRASALRAGFLASSGKYILTSRMDQAGEVPFFKEALSLLHEGHDLVREIRGSHRLDPSTLAFSWRLGAHAFAVQSSPKSLFDLELGLLAQARGYSDRYLPELPRAKLTWWKRWREYLTLIGLYLRLAARYRRGCFKILPPLAKITADDWGLSAGINEGILRLAQLGIVRRVSIMANTPHIEYLLHELRAIPQIELGMHFNLTWGRPSQKNPPADLPFLDGTKFLPSPPRFFFCWFWALITGKGKRSSNFVKAEFRAQLAQLRAAGVNPVHLDGHQHMHQVPGVIDILAHDLREAGIKQVRIPYDSSLWLTPQFPFLILSILARWRLSHYGFKYSSFIYPQMIHFQDHGLLRARLAQNPAAEVIVHPARTNDLDTLEFPDPYTHERVTEFRSLQQLGYNL